MRNTKSSRAYYRRKVTQYVKDKLARSDVKNIAIYLNGATGDDISYWRKSFKDVRRQPFGYIRFEI